MAEQKIDLKNIKKLDKNGNPKKKKSSQWQSVKGKNNRGAAKQTSNTAEKKKQVFVPAEWLYLTKEETGIQTLKTSCETMGLSVEYWVESGVIELSVDEQTILDFEQLDIAQSDDFSRQYCQKNQIKIVMAVSVRADNFAKIKTLMKKIADMTGGFFCVDDGNFHHI